MEQNRQPEATGTEEQKKESGAKQAFLRTAKAVLNAVGSFLQRAWIRIRQMVQRLWAGYRARPREQQLSIAAGTMAGVALFFAVLALVIGIAAGRRDAQPALTEAEAGQETHAVQFSDEELLELGPTEEWEDFPVQATEAAAEPLYDALKKHDTSDEVAVLQSRLIALGYLEIDEPTDYFGSATEYAVKLFQRQHDLEQDGIAGDRTLTLLYSDEAQKYMMKEGAEGRDVKLLQEQLNELGYLDAKQIDSVYGEVTQAAVMAFQKRNSLTADGKAGEKTLDKLYSDDAKVSSELAAKQKAEEEAAAKKAKQDAAKQKEQQRASDAAKAKEAKINKFISAATAKLGCEYVLGDRGPDTFDCSGFVWYCLKQAGISTTRLNAAGYSKKSGWKEIKSFSSVQKGDILFFRSNDSSRVSHTGIYIGGGMMIDASSGNGKVVKRAVSAYWKKNFVNARRPWA